MKKILIASNNPGKLQTARFVFTEKDNFQLFTPSDLNISLEVEETGTTYEQNALLKAEAFSKLVPKDFHVIADDSGINVDALPGQLGVKSRRFGAGPDASDQEWLDHFLQAVSHVTEPQERSSSMQTTTCLITDQGPLYFHGKLHGLITFKAKHPITKGLPFSSVFLIPQEDKVIAALDYETKSKYSHRIDSYRQVAEYLKKI